MYEYLSVDYCTYSSIYLSVYLACSIICACHDA